MSESNYMHIARKLTCKNKHEVWDTDAICKTTLIAETKNSRTDRIDLCCPQCEEIIESTEAVITWTDPVPISEDDYFNFSCPNE